MRVLVSEDMDEIIAAAGKLGSYRTEDEFMRDAINTLLAANKDLRLEIAIELYKEEKIQIGRAAESADLNYEDIKEKISEKGVELKRGPESADEMEDRSEELLGKA